MLEYRRLHYRIFIYSFFGGMGCLTNTGKQRIAVTGNTEIDKMASTGLTEKQLQLSVEVCSENTLLNTLILFLMLPLCICSYLFSFEKL